MIIRKIERKAETKRVAAYARVSTLDEDQEESYETQVNYYTRRIAATEGWVFVGMYADQGITGTSAEKRPNFMRLLDDARAGKIDLILCKSVSRFSRNYADAQKYVHELKSYHVEIRFEKDGINTFDSSADLIFSLSAAIAQEESRHISENVKWANRKLAERGIRHIGSHRTLGYAEVDGKLTPNEDAWIVKQIYEDYAAGLSPSEIINHLTETDAKRLKVEKDFDWTTLLRMLRNEIYVGDRLIQKAPPIYFLTKKPDLTEEYESKFIENDHEGIVSREIWNQVQKRLNREKQARELHVFSKEQSHFLYGKLFCAECGMPYRRFTAPIASGTHKVWRCTGRRKKNGCKNHQVAEEDILDWLEEVELGDERILVTKGRLSVEEKQPLPESKPA